MSNAAQTRSEEAEALQHHAQSPQRARPACSSLFEAPVMIYNACPFLEDAARLKLGGEKLTQAAETRLSLGGAGRKLKNGCVEFVDHRTGQRTRVAGDRTYGLLTPAAELCDVASEHAVAQAKFGRAREAIAKPNDAKKHSNKDTRSACQQPSNVLSPTFVTNTPHLLRQESEGETPFPFDAPRRKRGFEENICPGENLESFPGADPFLISHPNFSVLNKEVIHKRNGQGGFSGNVEKIRVEMESLEDGYKWRKYGRKEVKGNVYPRNYFKCTYPNCMCRKQVEQNPKNPQKLIATYEGRHTHPPPFISQQQQHHQHTANTRARH